MGDTQMTIGEAAALFGLPTSTLRWWERRGLLSPPRRRAGRRGYSYQELQHIAVIHFCREEGMVPLDDIAAILDGPATGRRWQDVIRGRVATLERQMRQLAGAHEFLTCLLDCTHDDPFSCPQLNEAIHEHLPGHGEPGDDHASCHHEPAAPAGPGRYETRDVETRTLPGERIEQRVTKRDLGISVKHCVVCGQSIRQASTGRPRSYCSRSCRQRAYRARNRRAC